MSGMYERLTDRARMVMQLANQEAQRFNHEYIGTEHILLGLIKEGSSIGAKILQSLEIDPRRIRLDIEKIMRAGPNMVTRGKLPQTPRSKKVIEFAIMEARELDHNYIGTEHLLLGLLREEEGFAAQVLMQAGLTLEKARTALRTLLQPSEKSPGRELLEQLFPGYQKILEGDVRHVLLPPPSSADPAVTPKQRLVLSFLALAESLETISSVTVTGKPKTGQPSSDAASIIAMGKEKTEDLSS